MRMNTKVNCSKVTSKNVIELLNKAREIKGKVFTILYKGYMHGQVSGIEYCERRYFRVYKFLRISKNWQFRADLFSRFFYIIASM